VIFGGFSRPAGFVGIQPLSCTCLEIAGAAGNAATGKRRKLPELASTRFSGSTMKAREGGAKAVSNGRHRANCTICAHEKREEIEADIVSWHGPAAIAEEPATDREIA
jgi:hypothetical protein